MLLGSTTNNKATLMWFSQKGAGLREFRDVYGSWRFLLPILGTGPFLKEPLNTQTHNYWGPCRANSWVSGPTGA